MYLTWSETLTTVFFFRNKTYYHQMPYLSVILSFLQRPWSPDVPEDLA